MALVEVTTGTGGGGALIVATRSDNSNPAVFADIAARDAYTVTPSGITDSERINVVDSEEATEVFAVGTLDGNNQVTAITAAYIRLNDAWVSVAINLVGTPGAPGSATDFSGVGSYELLMPGASPDFTPIAAGARRLNNGTGDFEFDATVIVPQESLQIGFGGVLSALGAIPLFRSFVTGRRGTFPFTYYDKTTGTSRTVELSAASNSRDESQSDDTDTVTTGGTFPLTTTAAEIISGIIVRPDDGVTVGGLRFRMTIQGQTDPFYYWPSRTLWDNSVGQDITGDGSANNDYLVDLINAPLFLLGISDPDDPVTLNIEFEFTSGSFKGNASGVPYIAVDRNIVTLRELAYVSEILPSDWDESDTTKSTFIENKPTLAPSDAEANVQSDWDETDTNSDAFILNKPASTPGDQNNYLNAVTQSRTGTDVTLTFDMEGLPDRTVTFDVSDGAAPTPTNEYKVFTQGTNTVTEAIIDAVVDEGTALPYRYILPTPSQYMVVAWHSSVSVQDIHVNILDAGETVNNITTSPLGNRYVQSQVQTTATYSYQVIDISSDIALLSAGQNIGIYVG